MWLDSYIIEFCWLWYIFFGNIGWVVKEFLNYEVEKFFDGRGKIMFIFLGK